MVSKMKKDVDRGKALIVLAHRDTEKFVYRNIAVPQVVPLYANFDLARRVGRAHLKPQQGLVYAVIYLEVPNTFGEYPSVVLALKGATRVTEEGVTYAQNGEVEAASIISRKEWDAIYGPKEKTS